MYVAKPLSYYQQHPDAVATPPDGPNSGYLVIQDEEAETNYCCFGLCEDNFLTDLPFPQNKNLTIHFSSGGKSNSSSSYDDVVFIPVLNQPLSSHRYYAIQPHGSHIGEAFTCSKEDDVTSCCYSFACGRDIKPRPLNPNDVYQQFEISTFDIHLCSSKGGFYAKSVASDGFPPSFLGRKGWGIYTDTRSMPKNHEMDEAHGINKGLRSRLPKFNAISISCKSSESVVVGKWYCPFMFVKEGTLRDQVKKSMFYQMTLEQKWEQIFSSENEHYNKPKVMSFDVAVQREIVFVGGREAAWDKRNVVDGAIWFTSYDEVGNQMSVGLSLEIVERLKWEEKRGGWIGGEEREVRVKREEEFGGGVGEGWKKFGCYVLIERFVLKRMDGSLVLTYEFKHIHQIRTKLE